jgi:hypothetical protein
MSKNHHTITEATEYGGQPAFPDFATGDMASVYRGDQSFSRLKAAFPSGEPPYMEGVPDRQRLFSKNSPGRGNPRVCGTFQSAARRT